MKEGFRKLDIVAGRVRFTYGMPQSSFLASSWRFYLPAPFIYLYTI